jgi:glutathione S-transferase
MGVSLRGLGVCGGAMVVGRRAMLKVYHVPLTRSVRTVWLVRELELPHELVAMPFDHAVMHGPDYLRVNPVGKVPAIDDDGFVLTESGAIAQYLLARYGQGRLAPAEGPGTPAHGRFLQWLYFPEATLMPQLGVLLRQARRPQAQRHPDVIAEARGKAAELLAYCEDQLARSPYILGADFTAADIMLGYTLALADDLQLVGEAQPATRAYLARLATRPAFQVAMTP